MIVGSNSWSSVAYGNGIFVVGGEKGYVTTSTDEEKHGQLQNNQLQQDLGAMLFMPMEVL